MCAVENTNAKSSNISTVMSSSQLNYEKRFDSAGEIVGGDDLDLSNFGAKRIKLECDVDVDVGRSPSATAVIGSYDEGSDPPEEIGGDRYKDYTPMSLTIAEEDKANCFDSQIANMTLWQFLLELLCKGLHPDIIRWTSRDGEFMLLQSEEVARLWGLRKNQNHRMNYDKLSRALRYYYQKNIIRKVPGHKFVYRFVHLPEVARVACQKACATATGVAGGTRGVVTTPSSPPIPADAAVTNSLPWSLFPPPKTLALGSPATWAGASVATQQSTQLRIPTSDPLGKAPYGVRKVFRDYNHPLHNDEEIAVVPPISSAGSPTAHFSGSQEQLTRPLPTHEPPSPLYQAALDLTADSGVDGGAAADDESIRAHCEKRSNPSRATGGTPMAVTARPCGAPLPAATTNPHEIRHQANMEKLYGCLNAQKFYGSCVASPDADEFRAPVVASSSAAVSLTTSLSRSAAAESASDVGRKWPAKDSGAAGFPCPSYPHFPYPTNPTSAIVPSPFDAVYGGASVACGMPTLHPASATFNNGGDSPQDANDNNNHNQNNNNNNNSYVLFPVPVKMIDRVWKALTAIHDEDER